MHLGSAGALIGRFTMILSTIIWIVSALVLFGLILWAVGVYNSVVSLDRAVGQVFGNLESVMKQRHDELPKLVNACQAYMQHEAGLLEQLTRLRAGFAQAASPEEKVTIENELNRTLGKLNLVWENYPELKANQQFLQIHDRVSALETTLNDRREQFNEAVTQHNILIAQFPALLLAGAFSWREKPILEIAAADRTDNLAPFPLKGS
jgi:LemA protein